MRNNTRWQGYYAWWRCHGGMGDRCTWTGRQALLRRLGLRSGSYFGEVGSGYAKAQQAGFVNGSSHALIESDAASRIALFLFARPKRNRKRAPRSKQRHRALRTSQRSVVRAIVAAALIVDVPAQFLIRPSAAIGGTRRSPSKEKDRHREPRQGNVIASVTQCAKRSLMNWASSSHHDEAPGKNRHRERVRAAMGRVPDREAIFDELGFVLAPRRSVDH